MRKCLIAVFMAGILIPVLGWGMYRFVFTAKPASSTHSDITVAPLSDTNPPDTGNSGEKNDKENGGEGICPRLEINLNLSQILQENGTRKDTFGPDNRSTHGGDGSVHRYVVFAALALFLLLAVAILRRNR